MDKIKNQEILCQYYDNLNLTNKGTDQSAMDPTDPNNWDAVSDKGEPLAKFVDQSVYKSYLEEHSDLEKFLNKKYQTK